MLISDVFSSHHWKLVDQTWCWKFNEILLKTLKLDCQINGTDSNFCCFSQENPTMFAVTEIETGRHTWILQCGGFRCDSQGCGAWAMKAPQEKGSYSAKQKNLGRDSQQTRLRGNEWWKSCVLQGGPYKNSKCLVKVCAVETRKGGALHQIDMVNQGGLQRLRVWGRVGRPKI